MNEELMLRFLRNMSRHTDAQEQQERQEQHEIIDMTEVAKDIWEYKRA